MTTEAEEEIIDVGLETKEDHSPRESRDHLVPSSPSSLPNSPTAPLILSPRSPFQAYSARLRCEADYER